MSILIFAAPNPIPAQPENPNLGFACTWVGPDGSIWDLANGTEGVVLQSGVEGLHDPPVTVHTSTSSAIPGNRVRGWRAEARPVFWPVQVMGATADEWRDRYDRFFKTIHPVSAGRWRVGVGGTYRELNLTGTFGENYRMRKDPHLFGRERYGVTLEAAQPFWTGETVKRGPWAAPVAIDFIDPAGSPPFHISSSAAFGSAYIPNPGDVESYVRWVIEDDLDAVEVGTLAGSIEVPFEVPAGQRLVIDTDPRNVSAVMGAIPADGEPFIATDMTAELGFQPMLPVPPGERVQLNVSATGSGRVSVELTPLYMRAF